MSLAYEVLRDPERRARYDRYGPEGVFGQSAGGGHGRLRLRGRAGRHLRGLLRLRWPAPARGRRGPQRAPTPRCGPDLEFAEAVFGGRKEISVRLPVRCTVCAAWGRRPGTQPVTCSDCQGTGELRRVRQSLLGQVVTSVACPRCPGSGEMIPHPCPECRGEGRRIEDSTFTVEVPAGVEDGSTLRLADRGPAGQRGGPSGSLFVHLAVTPDERFERRADDLHTMVTVERGPGRAGHPGGVESLEATHRLHGGPGNPDTATSSASGEPASPPARPGPRRPLRPRGGGDPDRLDPRTGQLLRQFAAQRGEDVVTPGGGGGDGVFSRLRSAFG